MGKGSLSQCKAQAQARARLGEGGGGRGWPGTAGDGQWRPSPLQGHPRRLVAVRDYKRKACKRFAIFFVKVEILYRCVCQKAKGKMFFGKLLFGKILNLNHVNS